MGATKNGSTLAQTHKLYKADALKSIIHNFTRLKFDDGAL